MSYIDKKMCMESLRLKLGDIIPGNDIDQIITLVDDVLIDYDITAIKKDESKKLFFCLQFLRIYVSVYHEMLPELRHRVYR